MQSVEQEIEQVIEEILEASAEIIAEEATEYYKESFERKGWNGAPWLPVKNPPSRGSLMLRSTQLMNSIRPIEINKERVVIAAGYEDRVQYARVHNEGYDGTVNVKAFTRMVKGKPQQVKDHTRHMQIPQRQFMGVTDELEERLTTRIASAIESIFSED